jgi:hypothetical protein
VHNAQAFFICLNKGVLTVNQFTHDMIRMTEGGRLIEYWTLGENDLMVKMLR